MSRFPRAAPPLRDIAASLLDISKALFPKLAGVGASLLFLFVLSRSLGQNAYGQAALALTLAAFCAPASSLGQRFLLLRDLPGLMVHGAVARARLMVGRAAAVSALGALLAGMLAALALGLWPGGALDRAAWPLAALAAAALVIAGQGLLDFASQTVRALGLGDLAIYLREVLPRLAAIAALGLLAFGFGWAPALPWVLACLALGLALALVAAAVLCLRALAIGRQGGPEGGWAQIAAGLPFLPNALMATARENMDVLLVGLLIGPREVAVYFTLIKFSNFLTLPATALANTAIVEAVRLHARGAGPEALDRVRTLLLQSALITVPAALLIAFLAPTLLGVFDLDGDGFALVIGLVFLNGAIHGTCCSLWEVMQCLPLSKRFNAVFAAAVILGAAGMAALAVPFGVAGIAAGYLAANLTWIGFALWRLAAARS